MANNLDVVDANEAVQTVKTTDTGGVHTPHQNVDALPAAHTANVTSIKVAAEAIQAAVELLDDAVNGSQLDVGLAAALPAGSNTIGNVGVTTIGLPSVVRHGKKTVAVAGTAETLVGGSQVVSSGVTVKALAANVGTIYVGTTGVTSSTGFELAAGESQFIEIDDLVKVVIDASQSAEGVSYIGS